MAKKSTGTKHTSAQRRPTSSSGSAPKRPAIDQGRVTLVRAPSTSTATVTDDAPKAPVAVEAASAPKQAEVSAAPKAAARGVVSAPAKPAPAPARPAASTAARPTAPRVPPRSARLQARARANPLVTPEHYAYVRNDLIRTAVLATTMFVIIVVAYFILHAHGMA